METLGSNGQDFVGPNHGQLADDVDAGIITQDQADQIARDMSDDGHDGEIWDSHGPIPSAPTDNEHAEPEG